MESDVALDYLDNELNPTCGSLTVASCKCMLPWQRLKPSQGFLKLLFDQSFFFPIKPWIILGTRLRFGHLFTHEFNRIMPPERFYLGGQNSIRSYEPDFGPPLGCYIDDNGKAQLVPRGGKTMLNFNVEARILVWRSLGIVIFQDLGTLINTPHELNRGESHILAGTGFGIRYYTPVGPLRFDIGWKWHRFYEQEGSFAWFLTLGHAF